MGSSETSPCGDDVQHAVVLFVGPLRGLDELAELLAQRLLDVLLKLFERRLFSRLDPRQRGDVALRHQLAAVDHPQHRQVVLAA